MNSKWQWILLIISIFALSACSEQNEARQNAVEKEHFLTEKMQTIKKAEDVNQIIQDAATQQRRNIDEQGG